MQPDPKVLLPQAVLRGWPTFVTPWGLPTQYSLQERESENHNELEEAIIEVNKQ